MENPAAFDLNQAIQSWRESLAKSFTFDGESLNELESHLRDAIGDLQAKGLSAEEAFLVAVRRCGSRQQLKHEFGKRMVLERWFFRIAWIILTSLALLDALCFIQGNDRAGDGNVETMSLLPGLTNSSPRFTGTLSAEPSRVSGSQRRRVTT